jgi:hypothetical protein
MKKQSTQFFFVCSFWFLDFFSFDYFFLCCYFFFFFFVRREYVRTKIGQRQGIPFQQLFPKTSPLALNLLERMLGKKTKLINKQKRIKNNKPIR